ncbi:MAG TPA: hypothetical protein VIP98_07525 [Microlunatus sp.]
MTAADLYDARARAVTYVAAYIDGRVDDAAALVTGTGSGASELADLAAGLTDLAARLADLAGLLGDSPSTGAEVLDRLAALDRLVAYNRSNLNGGN